MREPPKLYDARYDMLCQIIVIQGLQVPLKDIIPIIIERLEQCPCICRLGNLLRLCEITHLGWCQWDACRPTNVHRRRVLELVDHLVRDDVTGIMEILSDHPAVVTFERLLEAFHTVYEDGRPDVDMELAKRGSGREVAQQHFAECDILREGHPEICGRVSEEAPRWWGGQGYLDPSTVPRQAVDANEAGPSTSVKATHNRGAGSSDLREDNQGTGSSHTIQLAPAIH